MMYFREDLSLRANAERLLVEQQAVIDAALASLKENPQLFLSWGKEAGLAKSLWLRDAMQGALNWLDAGETEALAEQYLVQHAIDAVSATSGFDERLMPHHREAARELLLAMCIELRSGAQALLAARDAKRAAYAKERAQKVHCRRVEWAGNGFWVVRGYNVDGALLEGSHIQRSNKLQAVEALKQISPAAPRNELRKKDGSLDRVL